MSKKVREVVKRLDQEGYALVRTRGSHRQFRSPDGSVLVTVPGKPSDTLKAGTLGSIRRATGLEDLR